MRPADTLKYGQSIWLDYMRRQLLTSGRLEELRDEGLRGVTSNPSIFEAAFSESDDYEDAIRALVRKNVQKALTIYENLAVEDIQGAADVLRPVYDETEGADGFVCLEVSPRLAHDTTKTVEEARRLFRLIDRPNAMIKVPATDQGIPAIRRLLSEGINVNVTLMFSASAYARVVDAYLGGIEAFHRSGGDLRKIASVASIFVSRFDVMVDPMLEERAEARPERREEILALKGQVGMANAKRIYRDFRRSCAGERYAQLAKAGARPQRILFASTSTKDPSFSDVRYVEALIGPDTVDTLPPKTLDAFCDHGRVRPTLEERTDEAEAVLDELAALGISLDEVEQKLLDEGVEKFANSFDELLSTIEKRRDALAGRHIEAR